MSHERKKRLSDPQGVDHIRHLRENWTSAKTRAEAEVRDLIERRVSATRTLTMDAVIKAIEQGYTKTIIVQAMGVTRQTLDRWIKEYETEVQQGADFTAMLEADRPKRYTALDYTYATYTPHTGVLVHDNEGEFEDMLLLPASGQTRGWEWGDRHTSYLHPTKERIPQEVLDLIVEDEVEAYGLASKENQDKWRGWTSNPAIKALKSGPKAAPVTQPEPEAAPAFAKLTGEDDDLEFA